MNQQRRNGWSMVTAVCLLILLGACDAGADTPQATTPPNKAHLQIMVGGLSKQIYLPNILAKQLGFFDEQGLNVTLLDEVSGQSAEDSVLAGQVDAGSGSYNHTIDLQAAGKNIECVVQLNIAPGEAEMVSTRLAGQIKSVSDLKGRNLGLTELGSGTESLTVALLDKAGISRDQVHLLPVGAGDTFIAAMQQGRIDAGMTTEPTISRLLASGEGSVLVDLRTPASTTAALGAPYPFICIFMTGAYVTNHKDTVQRMVNAYIKTLRWINSHKVEEIVAKVPVDYYSGDKTLYTTALQNQLAIFSPDGKMPPGGAEAVLAIEQKTNQLVSGKKIDLSQTFTNEFTDKANSQ